MLIDGEIIKDGHDMIRYLDRRLLELREKNVTVTGIVIGSDVRMELTRACQSVAGKMYDSIETVNRFRGAILIEDGMNRDRLEVVHGPNVTLPVEGNPFGMIR